MDNQTFASQGSILGAILLVAGCCIGAGMLGLPVLSAQAGFKPSVIMFIICWIFMLSTGLLLLEANLWFKEDINVVSLADRTLGKMGKAVGWIVFLFLFYSLMVAYVSGSGALFADFFDLFFAIHLPRWVGGLIMSALFGLMIYNGTGTVDKFNRLLMFGLILTYLLIVCIGSSHIDEKLLKHHDWSAAFFVIPAMIVSFGFHNLVPSLTQYLGRDSRRLCIALAMGSFIPLIIYLAWQRLILGIVPLEGEDSLRVACSEGQMATQALKTVVGASWVVDIAQFFAFFAIVTSFLGVALSFVDFLADGFKIPKKSGGKIALCSLALLPPYLFSLIHPGVFLTALNYAGGFGAVIIFGILPALMVWSGRYHKNFKGPQFIAGGKPILLLIILCSVSIIILQLYQTITS
ncbi:amino acid permease [Neochlamydia sp. EPS4]|uniref:amino acid permease n=1 Tax=Neochlamydia sp. EPS4 TaxID=1478175 RepID=UPI0005D10A04|nr:aromatic amino acid transport family protein [Neochlamydia sp. EPS4]